ncbi:GntR family transcriptional regulator [Paenibacillus lycopersici]|uniref:GntR family transcriptional regulator n=1 Tax=Paenibacillus lycopersici TaxID=2704462 RepID=A0A6C0G0J0_9BACL|nr:GntR family transcriptional regulator [Paenibacillus lycopersici]QHT62938.1 GntR family transcriptional regulator [Paenibacillus lycopersici]
MRTGHSVDADIPVYQTIANILHGEIEQQVYRPGDRIPSEQQLCRRFKVNRYTLRQSLDLLVQIGLIRSHQGKGYYVCGKPLDIEYTISPVTRISDLIRKLGRRPGAELIRQEIVVPPSDVAEVLALSPGRQVYRLEILRTADDVPLSFNVTWLPADIFPGLLEHTELFHSLYGILQQEYGIQLTRIGSTFRIAYPMLQEAQLLNIQPSTNLLQIDSVMRDEANRRLEYTSAKYRGDLCKISISLE